MPLSIKNAETERLARELSDLTGQSVTEAVTKALRAAIEAQQASEGARALKRERLRRISVDAGRRWPEHLRHVDHGELLYDEDGLPK